MQNAIKEQWTWQGWARWGETNIGCNHGLDFTLPAKDHPVSKFIDAYYMTLLQSNNMNMSPAYYVCLWELLSRHLSVEEDRRMIIRILTSIGANLLLQQSSDILRNESRMEPFTSSAILVLENFDASKDWTTIINSHEPRKS